MSPIIESRICGIIQLILYTDSVEIQSHYRRNNNGRAVPVFFFFRMRQILRGVPSVFERCLPYAVSGIFRVCAAPPAGCS